MLPSISGGCRRKGVPKNLAVIVYTCQEKEEKQGHFLKRLKSRGKSLPAYNCFKDQIRGKKKKKKTALLWFLQVNKKKKYFPVESFILGIRFIFKIHLRRDCLGHNSLAQLGLTYPVRAFWCLYAIIRCSKSLPSGYTWESIIWGLNATKHPYLSLMAI